MKLHASTGVLEDVSMRIVGLFSGVGGLERGLTRGGSETELLCESWEDAASVLRTHFSAPVVGDIRQLGAIPEVDIVAAGFPCTDLSQVGRKAGIGGEESGLVREVFRLIEATPPSWLVLENVPNMLTLSGGSPIRHITEWLDEHRWNWAYRTVDSQYFGVPQRRRRVFLVASRDSDPREVLFADEFAPRTHGQFSGHGFYWTEGNRGVGWGDDIVPTLKGGSKLGIPSPPAVWRVGAPAGRAIVRPTIRVGEQLQGFPPGWTEIVHRVGQRWKMVGNAVTVPVAEWIGSRLRAPGEPVVAATPFVVHKGWPSAASCVAGHREQWRASESPIETPRVTIRGLMRGSYEPLSYRATAGFHQRLTKTRLRAGGDDFRTALASHARVMASS